MTAHQTLAATMSEASLQANVIDLCKVYGLLVYHTHDSRRSEPGFPDLVIVGREAVLFRELKANRGKPTIDQLRWLDALHQAGADASVWYPTDWPYRIRTQLEALR